MNGELILLRPSSSRLSLLSLLFCPPACPSCPSVCPRACQLGQRQRTTSKQREQGRTATRVLSSYLAAPFECSYLHTNSRRLRCDGPGSSGIVALGRNFSKRHRRKRYNAAPTIFFPETSMRILVVLL